MDNLTHLSFNVVKFRDEGFLRLSSFLKTNTSLKCIGIGRDKIDDMSVATSFSDAIKNHPTLESISLEKLEMNKNILGKVLEGCCRLTEVRFGRDAFLSEGTITILADFIRCNHPIEGMTFAQCKITDSDALVLASALNPNTTLRQLDLKQNDITEEGEKTLLNALYDPTSMDSIIQSNHTCVPYTYDIFDKAIQSKRMSLFEWELYKIQINSHMKVIKKNRGDYNIEQNKQRRLTIGQIIRKIDRQTDRHT